MIVITNEVPGYHHGSDWRSEGWFQMRFTCVEIKMGQDEQGFIAEIN